MTRTDAHLTLANAEAWLVAVSTHPAGALAGARAVRGRLELAPPVAGALESFVTAGPRLSALERLAIYNDGYHARLIECLLDDYPALEFALGSEAFATLAREYIARHPSRAPVLDRYGAHLADFCASRSESWALFARDLARLEWALVEAVHAPASSRLDVAALARDPAGLARARFVPNASLSVLRFDYPVNEFFQAFKDELDPALPSQRATAVVVTREGLALVRRTLDPLAATLLAELVAGHRLDQAIERMLRASPDTDTALFMNGNLQGWFASWVSCGFFATLDSTSAD